MGASMSSMNFAVMMRGPDQDTAMDYSGYQGSNGRMQYAALVAARDWHRRFVDSLERVEAPATPRINSIFADIFQATHERWSTDSNWWWVRERMLTLAATFGERALLPLLATHLQSPFAEGGHSEARSATAACAALAAITGVELRFDEHGSALPVATVAKAYLKHLDLK